MDDNNNNNNQTDDVTRQLSAQVEVIEHETNPTPDKTCEELSFFQAGTVIFKEGDAGGDLFIIQEGMVSIYTEKEGKEVPLSEMTTGEVMGLITCLTNSVRLASAKAKTNVSVKVVKHEHIQKLIKSLPEWMKIVLKEFTIRLTHMNDAYSKLYLESQGQAKNPLNSKC